MSARATRQGRPMIVIENLSVFYEETVAVDDVSLSIAEGECVLITGSSGCGKTTLGRAIAGLIPQALPLPISGRVTVAGIDTSRTPLPQIAQSVGMVFQNPSAQLFHLRVEDEVAFGPRNLGLHDEEVAERVAWALGALGIDGLRDCRPNELSGGQQQRVAIASALAMRPAVLVLDEPTASLDAPGVAMVVETLRELHDTGLTLVLIEHRVDSVLSLASLLVEMQDGRIIGRGEPDAMLRDHALCERLGILGSSNRATRERSGAQRSVSRWVGPALTVRNLDAGYRRGFPILRDVNLELAAGECVAVVGDNGAGKSTLGLTVAGLLRPSRGSVEFGASAVPGADVSMLFQDPGQQLFCVSVAEEIAFGPRNFDRFDDAEHEGLLEDTDLAHLRDRQPFALSVGQQQRVALAAVLALRPKVLVVDEPTIGQDWPHLCALMSLLNEQVRLGAAILLITHDERLVRGCADRILHIRDGSVTEECLSSPLRRCDKEASCKRYTTRELVLLGVFGAMWGASEVSLGSVLHAIRLPLTGTMMTAIGMVIVCIARTYVPRRGSTLFIGAIAALLKLLSIGSVVLGPMIGIIAEAILAEIVLSAFGKPSLLSSVSASVAAVMWTLIHPFFTGLIFFGSSFLGVWEQTLYEGTRLFGIDAGKAVAIVLSAMVLIRVVVGVLAGVLGWSVSVLLGRRRIQPAE